MIRSVRLNKEDVSKSSAAVLDCTLATDFTAGVKKSKKLDCVIGRTIRVKRRTTFFSFLLTQYFLARKAYVSYSFTSKITRAWDRLSILSPW